MEKNFNNHFFAVDQRIADSIADETEDNDDVYCEDYNGDDSDPEVEISGEYSDDEESHPLPSSCFQHPPENDEASESSAMYLDEKNSTKTSRLEKKKTEKKPKTQKQNPTSETAKKRTSGKDVTVVYDSKLVEQKVKRSKKSKFFGTNVEKNLEVQALVTKKTTARKSIGAVNDSQDQVLTKNDQSPKKNKFGRKSVKPKRLDDYVCRSLKK